MSRLLTLPPELLLGCSRQLEYTCDLNALARTCKDLYSVLNHEVYKRLHKTLTELQRTREYTPLHWAAENGKDLCVREMMRSGISTFLVDDMLRNPVVLAAGKGHTEVVRTLLDFGVNADGWLFFYEEEGKMTPLNAAIKNGHLSVVKLLIEYDVELEYDFRLSDDEDSETSPIHWSSFGLPRMPLPLAVMHQRNDIVEELLKHRCHPWLPARVDNAFLTAAECNEAALRIFLRHGTKVKFKSGGRDRLFEAMGQGDIGLFKYFWEEYGARFVVNYDPSLALSDEPEEDKDLAYLFSLNVSNSPKMAALLLEKIDVEEVIQKKCLHPMRFVMEGAASWGYEDLLRRFLAIDWTERHPIDDDEWLQHLSICLARAVKGGFINIVQLMLENGADVNGVDPSLLDEGNSFDSPIIEAVRREDFQMVKFLLKNGADPRLTYLGEPIWSETAFGSFPWIPPVSEAQFQIIECLLDNDCLDHPETFPRSTLLARSVYGGERLFDLVRSHIEEDLAPGDDAHQAALCSASFCGKTGIIQRLLDTGLDPNVVQMDGNSLILLAAASAKLSMEEAESTVSFLLSQGAKIDSENSETGETNLSLVCNLPVEHFDGCWERTAKILVEKGANLFNTYGNEFPLVNAARNSHLGVVKVFLQWFEQENTPFKEIKTMIERAIESSTDADTERVLRRFYWPRVYPASSS